jgi:hypothetical protein
MQMLVRQAATTNLFGYAPVHHVGVAGVELAEDPVIVGKPSAIPAREPNAGEPFGGGDRQGTA